MAAASSARLSDIGFSLEIGSPRVRRRARQYIPAAGPELTAPAERSFHAFSAKSGCRAGKSLGVEPGRQAEGREDLRILEHRVPADALGGDGEDLKRVQLVSAAGALVGGEPGLAVGRD